MSVTTKYVIITPARNEAMYIEKTIESVVCQTVLPLKWIIIDDNSTDETSFIVNKYLHDYSFISLVKNESDDTRNFGNKVFAIRKGFNELKKINYDYYCNLDADVSFESYYFETLLKKFNENPKLGICGGRVYDKYGDIYKVQKSSLMSVAGPIQFFRKECYEDIGEYKVSELGLIDAIAEVTARMKAWETRTYPELIVKHHRKISSQNNSIIGIALREGKTDYQLGYHPLWHFLRSCARIGASPILLGSILRSFSFINCYIFRKKRIVDNEFVEFLRKEEFQKIKGYILNLIKHK